MAVRSLNKVMIIGNLTRDPELKYTSTGTALATFGVATNREYSPSNTEEVYEDTEYHNVVAWAKLAELCNQLLKKGQKVYIEGRLNTRSWQDSETGKTMYRTEIVASDMIVLSLPRRETGQGVEIPKSDGEKVQEVEPEAVVEDMEAVDDQTVKDDAGEIPF